MLGDLLKTGARLASNTPLSSLALTTAAAGIAKPVLDSVVHDPFHDAVVNTVEDRRDELLQRAKAERLRRTMAMNTARLASLDPHLYNEVLAGRRLAPGTVVFGGTPRKDLMDLLAARMSGGSYTPPPPAQGELGSMF